MTAARIHTSTKVVYSSVLFCICLYSLLSWFGLISFDFIYPSYADKYAHGWPFKYAMLDANSFSWLAFIADMLMAAVLSAVVAVPGEMHLRKYGSFFRFGTGTVLAAMAVFAILFSLIGRESIRSVKQSAAIRRLEQAGQKVSISCSQTRYHTLYQWIDPRLEGVPTSIYVQSADLRDERLLPADIFQEVERMDIINSMLSDGSYTAIGKLTKLRNLSIYSSHSKPVLSAKNLRSLTALDLIEGLGLSGLDLRGIDFQALKEMKSLSGLNLRDSIVEDSQLDALAELPRLRGVCLIQTPITDKGFERLANSKSLRYLTIFQTSITKSVVQKVRLANPDLEILPR